jgi:hypothetical protein
MPVVLALLLAFLLPAPRLEAARTVNAKSGSLRDVREAVQAAADGETVMIPPGTSEWESGLTIKKAITLQGSGVGGTIIKDNSSSGVLLTFELVANKISRLTGIEFQQGSRLANSYNGIVTIHGSNLDSRRIRVDHCKFNQLNGWALMPDTALGVIDHNIFLCTVPAGVGYVKDTSWNGHSFGDGAWADADQFGTDQFTFFEDNTITWTPNANNYGLLDAQAGARYVARYNTITKGELHTHGTESGGRERSARAVEIYNNTFIGDPAGTGDTPLYLRGGVTLVHDNTIRNYQPPDTNFRLLYNRSKDLYVVFGKTGADGTNPWDVNQPGGPFLSGTATGAGSLTVTVSGANWTPNKWRGYSIVRTSNLRNLSGDAFSVILGNTASTITFSGSTMGQNLQFSPGDTFAVYKVVHGLDQPGRSGGSLVTGGTPALPAGWNNQTTSPCYEWNNSRDGGNNNVHFSSANDPVIRENEHYFNSTPKPGYTPYTYPHPLTMSLPASPLTPPSATTITQNKFQKKEKNQKRRTKWGKGKKTEENSAPAAEEQQRSDG